MARVNTVSRPCDASSPLHWSSCSNNCTLDKDPELIGRTCTRELSSALPTVPYSPGTISCSYSNPKITFSWVISTRLASKVTLSTQFKDMSVGKDKNPTTSGNDKKPSSIN